MPLGKGYCPLQTGGLSTAEREWERTCLTRQLEAIAIRLEARQSPFSMGLRTVLPAGPAPHPVLRFRASRKFCATQVAQGELQA